MNFFSHLNDSLGGLEILFSWRLVVAALLGMCMGLERSMAGKHAGMRTYAMVSVGAALFVTLGTLAAYALSVFPNVNPLQIASSVVVGIGFIGSGLAVFRGDHPVELTTAAGIWAVAGVGMACGFGFYLLATTATIVSVLVFTFFSRIERKLRVRYGIEVK
ncbi:MAG: MgtC/SapB family protein [Candidatus Adlerbacteria bacterium]